jgi:hypothetical protein
MGRWGGLAMQPWEHGERAFNDNTAPTGLRAHRLMRQDLPVAVSPMEMTLTRYTFCRLDFWLPAALAARMAANAEAFRVLRAALPVLRPRCRATHGPPQLAPLPPPRGLWKGHGLRTPLAAAGPSHPDIVDGCERALPVGSAVHGQPSAVVQSWGGGPRGSPFTFRVTPLGRFFGKTAVGVEVAGQRRARVWMPTKRYAAAMASRWGGLLSRQFAALGPTSPPVLVFTAVVGLVLLWLLRRVGALLDQDLSPNMRAP